METNPEEPKKKSVDATFEALLEPIQKPIMSEAVETDALDALTQYLHKDVWRQWGLNTLRKQGSAILLQGPPGTGKTTIARWLARKLKKGYKKLDVAAIGGGDPGQSEKGVRLFFDDARKRGNATVVLDECDNLLGSRIDISDDTWKLGTIEELMMQMNIYPGLVMCMTNHPEKLDPALADRFMSIIEVGSPDLSMRIRLWKQKWPEKYPLQPTEGHIKKLAKHELTGRQIETVIVRTSAYCIRKRIKPKLSMFHLYSEKELGKHIQTEGEK